MFATAVPRAETGPRHIRPGPPMADHGKLNGLSLGARAPAELPKPQINLGLVPKHPTLVDLRSGLCRGVTPRRVMEMNHVFMRTRSQGQSNRAGPYMRGHANIFGIVASK